MAENAAEQIILKVKAESEKAGLQLNTKKFKVIKTAGNCDIKTKLTESVQDFIRSFGSKND